MMVLVKTVFNIVPTKTVFIKIVLNLRQHVHLFNKISYIIFYRRLWYNYHCFSVVKSCFYSSDNLIANIFTSLQH